MARNFLIVGVGEVLWDHFPNGSTMGGAPANVACHARALGADAAVISRVGDDSSGRKLVERLSELGVTTAGISIDEAHATGSVLVQVQADGQPSYVIAGDVAWDFLEPSDSATSLIERADAVCFGTLAQRSAISATTIRELLGSARSDSLRVLDVNLRQDNLEKDLLISSLHLANVLKLNDAELPNIARVLGIRGTVREIISILIDQFELKMVAYTRGAEGSVLSDGRVWYEEGAREIKLHDTIGAGDSFVAALTLGMLKQWPIDKISAAANEVAAHVCSMAGAIPELSPSVIDRFLDDAPA